MLQLQRHQHTLPSSSVASKGRLDATEHEGSITNIHTSPSLYMPAAECIFTALQGLGVPRRSLSKAFMHYFQAASLGHVQAMYNTAIMHMTGKGTPKACKPALSNLKALVEKGPLAATLQAGHEAFFRGQHAQVQHA